MFVEQFKAVQQDVHENAKNKGWWKDDDDRQDGVKICLMHSELSEALEIQQDGVSNSGDLLANQKLINGTRLVDIVIAYYAKLKRKKVVETEWVKDRFGQLDLKITFDD